jgi:hypothetical protein
MFATVASLRPGSACDEAQSQGPPAAGPSAATTTISLETIIRRHEGKRRLEIGMAREKREWHHDKQKLTILQIASSLLMC